MLPAKHRHLGPDLSAGSDRRAQKTLLGPEVRTGAREPRVRGDHVWAEITVSRLPAVTPPA